MSGYAFWKRAPSEHYWRGKKQEYQCKACSTRTSLKSGTVMHASNLSFKDWFWTMALMSSTKNAFSAKEVQKQLGKKRWVHTAISNAKGIIRNVYRCVDEGFLENYLNEYCFKLNRRYFRCLMDRTLVASVHQKWNYLG